MDDESPHATLQKNFVKVICCPHLKFSQQGLFSAKKRTKQKVALLSDSRIFLTHYLLEVETREIVGKSRL